MCPKLYDCFYFIFSIFATALTCKTSDSHKKFNDMLNESQKAKYFNYTGKRIYIFNMAV